MPIEQVSKYFKVLNTFRFLLLRYVHEHPNTTVQGVMDAFNKKQSVVSVNLVMLKKAGLLTRESEGTKANYKISEQFKSAIAKFNEYINSSNNFQSNCNNVISSEENNFDNNMNVSELNNFDLGFAYLHGKSIASNYKKSLEHFEKSLLEGNQESLYFIGIIHEQGKGVPQNIPLAIEYFEKAAACGNLKALCHLGSMYFNGLGVSQDYTKAFTLFKSAAISGHVDAQKQIGTMYYHGLGITKNWIMSYAFFDISNAQKYKNIIESQLTTSQIQQAKIISSRLKDNNFKDFEDNNLLISNETKCTLEQLNTKHEFIKASICGDLPKITKIINEGYNINTIDDLGRTALIYATAYGHLSIINLLLKFGADKNIADNEGKKAIDYATEKGFTELCSLLY
ncbi:MAG: hypothetical protein GYA62_16455 [Bacteroidales bacterium]|nr:hypothetical protein [Bacteroidales bacterium]